MISFVATAATRRTGGDHESAQISGVRFKEPDGTVGPAGTKRQHDKSWHSGRESDEHGRGEKGHEQHALQRTEHMSEGR